MKFILLLVFKLFYIISTQAVNFSLPIMFADEICSYNGVNIAINSTANVLCSCNDDYTNDPNSVRTINGVPVQCSYEKKRRFIALFLSIFVPLGFDYLYLGRYVIFVTVFLLCGISIFGNCARFAMSDNTDYFKQKWNLFFIVLAVTMVLFTIINIVLMATGSITDGNSVDTVQDLYFLVNVNNQ